MPLKVLFVSHGSSLYGAQLSLLSLLKNLDRSRIQPIVLVGEKGPLVGEVEKLDIPVRQRHIVHWVAWGKAADQPWPRRAIDFASTLRGRVWGIARVIERDRIDVVYTNTVTCIEGALAARITKRPHVWHLREQITGNSDLRSVLPAFMVPWVVSALSRRVIVNSRYLAKAYSFRGDQGRLSVVYNGIDTEEFQQSRSESSLAVRVELEVPAGCKIVSIVGAVTPRKRIDLFVEAAKELRSSGIDAAFLVVGEGPAAYQRVIKDQVERHGLTSNFRFLGHRTDVGRLLAASDVLVVTADEEPFGRTIIEAMAASTPVVATRCGGPEEIIIDGVTGLLVPRNDVVAVSSAVRRLLTEALLGDGILQAASRRLSEQFSLDAYSIQVQRRIESAVE